MTSTVLNQMFDINILKINGLLNRLTAENSQNRINAQTATAGFYMRHIAEAQILLCNLFFDTKLTLPYGAPQTMRVPSDDGRLFDIEETRPLMEAGYAALKEAIANTDEETWQASKPTFFGEGNRLQGVARILNHSAHHGGQIELAIKKGVQ
jgi:DinB superfamily